MGIYIVTNVMNTAFRAVFLTVLLRAKYNRVLTFALLIGAGLLGVAYNALSEYYLPGFSASEGMSMLDAAMNMAFEALYLSFVMNLFSNRFTRKLLVYANIFIARLVSALLMDTILKLLAPAGTVIFEDAHLLTLYYVLCTASFAFLLILGAGLWRRFGGDETKAADENGYAVFTVVQLIMMMLIAFLCLQVKYQTYGFLASGIAFVMCIYADIRLFHITSRVSEARALEKQNEELALRQELERSYYMALNEQNRSAARLRHDFRNHLYTLAGLLEQGEAQRAGEYIAELTQKEAESAAMRTFDTGNATADAVLGIKCAKAKRLGIETEVRLGIPECARFMKDTDIMSIIANMLDNACEGVLDAPEGVKKRISIRSFVNAGIFTLTSQNPCRADIAFLDGLPATSKPDPADHGKGCAIIRAAAEKYGGSASFAAKDGIFTAQVFINCAQNGPV